MILTRLHIICLLVVYSQCILAQLDTATCKQLLVNYFEDAKQLLSNDFSKKYKYTITTIPAEGKTETINFSILVDKHNMLIKSDYYEYLRSAAVQILVQPYANLITILDPELNKANANQRRMDQYLNYGEDILKKGKLISCEQEMVHHTACSKLIFNYPVSDFSFNQERPASIIFWITQNSELKRVQQHYFKGLEYSKTIDIKYQVQEKYTQAIFDQPILDLLFDEKGDLRQAFQGFQIQDNRNTKHKTE